MDEKLEPMWTRTRAEANPIEKKILQEKIQRWGKER